jgi:hypothetical protein
VPGASYPLSDHRPGVLLLDVDRIEAVSLDYHKLMTSEVDGAGNLRTRQLTVPAGTDLPESLEVVVLLDAYPLYRQTLSRVE